MLQTERRRDTPNQLRSVREKTKCRLRELGVRSGVSVATLSTIERYGYVPRDDTKRRIAEALGVGVGAIWPDAEHPEAEQSADYEAAQDAALARVAASDRRAFERATPAQQAALFIICRTHGTDDLEAMCRYVVDTVAQEGTCAEHEARMCEVMAA